MSNSARVNVKEGVRLPLKVQLPANLARFNERHRNLVIFSADQAVPARILEWLYASKYADKFEQSARDALAARKLARDKAAS